MYAVTVVKIFRFMEGEGTEMCLLLLGISKFTVLNWHGDEQIVTKLSIYNIFVLLYLNKHVLVLLSSDFSQKISDFRYIDKIYVTIDKKKEFFVY